MKKVRSSLFYRYLISYILVFLVPLLAFGVMFQVTALRDLSTEADASSVAALRQLRDILEQRLAELDAMAARITADPRLTVFQLRQGGFAGLEAVRELARYTSSSAMLLDVILVPRGHGNVFMSNGSMSWDRFVDSVATFEHSPPHMVRRLVDTTTAPTMLPIQEYSLGTGPQGVLVLVYPIPPRSPHPHATILYMIRASEVVRLMANVLPDSPGTVALIDSEGVVLVSYGQPNDAVWHARSERIAPGGFEDHHESVTSVRVNEISYSVAKVPSLSGDWRYVSVVGREAHQLRVTEMRNTLTVFALALAVVGVLVSFWFSWSSYTPIRALRKFALGQPPDADRTDPHSSMVSKFSEIDEILAGLSEAYKARDRLASAVERQRPLARAQLLTRLLQGIDDVVFRSIGPAAGLVFPYPHYFVFLIGFATRSGASALEREATIQSLGESRGAGYVAYGVEVHHRSAVAVIVNAGPNGPDIRVQRGIVSAVVSRLGGHYPATPTIAVGLVHPGTRGITNSYVEAMAAGEYVSAQDVRTQFFADITGPAARMPRLPLQLRLRLLQAVKEGQIDIAMETLDDIVKTVREVVVDDEARSMYFNDLSLALRAVPAQLGLEDQSAALPDTVGAFESLAELVRSLCGLIIVDRSSSADRLASHAVEFVDQNFGDGGLSLVLVADRFGTSLSHLSRVFKEHTGKTFSDYVSDLRIERMMLLLRSTDMTVQEIVTQVGYHDVSNCIRKFRQVVGVTPGKYRRGSGARGDPS